MIPCEYRPTDLSDPGRLRSKARQPGFFAIDPLKDSRWEQFLAVHPKSSVFHTVPWLTALRNTYSYEPIAFTTSPPGETLRNALLCCDVQTWLTARRLVSLPFSDHCSVLFDDPGELSFILSKLNSKAGTKQFGYLEIRPTEELDVDSVGPHAAEGYCGHQLDLEPDIETLFKNLHRSSTQRKIRRAAREGLKYQEGTSPYLLDSFYALLILTRRRHGLPPQPKRWFQSLIDSFGCQLEIRVASRNDQPIAAMLTLSHKDTLLYKYGCSNESFHNLGGVHLLFWQAILGAKERGLRTFDLGRSAWREAGLITFKDRWGAKRRPLQYFKLHSPAAGADSVFSTDLDWKGKAARKVFSRMPALVLRATGELIYPHIG